MAGPALAVLRGVEELVDDSFDCGLRIADCGLLEVGQVFGCRRQADQVEVHPPQHDVIRGVGRTWNAPFTYAFRYRDYVIDSFNQDKPFDRFITEQLAGDLLPARSVDEKRENLTATGLLALSSLPLNGGRLEAFMMDRVDDQLTVNAEVLNQLRI